MDDPTYTFAYQPIVDARQRRIVSFEALVRGPGGEPAYSVLERVDPDGLHEFDTRARADAIRLAASLGLKCHINLNFLPGRDVDRGLDAMTGMVELAASHGLLPSSLVLEVSERQAIDSLDHFMAQAELARSLGVQFAIDDFGAGFSGLNLLAQFQPDSLKLDMVLVREVQCRGPRQAIVRGVIRTCEDLGIDIVAEGVETLGEYEWLRDEGIDLFQGYLFSRPALRSLPDVNYPAA